VYPSALSQPRIQAHYNAAITPTSTTTRYLLGGLFETTSAGAITLSDVDGPAGDLAHYAGPPMTASTATYLYYNGHGSLAATANQAGTRTGDFTYDPFGAPLQAQPADSTVERFTGRWDKKLDTSSGLIEMGARPYDPTLGRFLSVDSIEGGALNNYDYALQDPVNQYDLDGQCVFGWRCPVKDAWKNRKRVVKGVVGAAVVIGGIYLAVKSVHHAVTCLGASAAFGGLTAAVVGPMCVSIGLSGAAVGGGAVLVGVRMIHEALAGKRAKPKPRQGVPLRSERFSDRHDPRNRDL
jgi:RHS repeat-associated protein